MPRFVSLGVALVLGTPCCGPRLLASSSNKCEPDDDRSKDSQDNVGNSIWHRYAQHRGLTLSNLARARDSRIDSHCARQSPTYHYGIHPQNTVCEQSADDHWRQCHYESNAQQHKPMRLDCCQRCGSVCQPDGGNKSTQSEIDERLLRRRRECSHCRSARAQPSADQPGNQSTATPT